MRLTPEPQPPPYHSVDCLLFVTLHETCTVARPTRFPLPPLQRYRRGTTYKFDRATPSSCGFVSLENGKMGVCRGGSCFAGLVSCVVCSSVFSSYPSATLFTENATDFLVRGAIQLGRRRGEVHCSGREWRKRGEGERENTYFTHLRCVARDDIFVFLPRQLVTRKTNKTLIVVGNGRKQYRASSRRETTRGGFPMKPSGLSLVSCFPILCRSPRAHVKIVFFLYLHPFFGGIILASRHLPLWPAASVARDIRLSTIPARL